MSIEQSLDGLAGAIHHLADAITRGNANAPTAAEAAAAREEGKTDKPPKPGKPAPAAAARPAPTKATAAAEPAAAPESKALDFRADIAPLFLELVEKKGPPAGRAIIDLFDASKTRLSEAVSAEQYPELLAALRAALEA